MVKPLDKSIREAENSKLHFPSLSIMHINLSLKQEKSATILLFLVLPVLLFVVFYLYPLVYSLYLSFHEWDGISPTIKPAGFRNYLLIAKDSYFLTALLNNAKWLIFSVLVPPSLGLLLAMLVNKKRVKGKGIFEITFFLPSVITPIAVASIWRWMYNPSYGVVNKFLCGAGLCGWAQNWLGDPQIATYSVMAAALWAGTGIPFVMYLAGLANIPQSLIDAARIDGASSLQIFRYVLWPMLAPANAVVIALSSLGAIRIFDLVYALTGGGPVYFSTVLSIYMYDVSFNRFQMGRGAAIAVIMFLLAAAIIGPYVFYSMRGVERIRQ